MMTDVLTVPVLRVRVLEHDALDDDAVLVRRRELLGCVGPVPRGRRPRRDARGAAADGHGATRGDEPRSAAERERATTRGGGGGEARAWDDAGRVVAAAAAPAMVTARANAAHILPRSPRLARRMRLGPRAPSLHGVDAKS